jgi:hypothetical protein
MVIAIDDIIIAAAVGGVASAALKEPIQQFVSSIINVGDLPIRSLLTAASNGLISLSDLESTSEFRKLDEDTKKALRLIVKAQQDRTTEVSLNKAAVELGKNANSAIEEIIKEYYDPLFKKLDAFKKILDDVDNDNANMEQKIFEEIAKVDATTLKSEITKLYKELAAAVIPAAE